MIYDPTHNCAEPYCTGLRLEEFEGRTLCEYEEWLQHVSGSYVPQKNFDYPLPQDFFYAKSLPSMLPKITIKGWWWKRFFRKYRMQKMVMQRLIDKEGAHIVDRAMHMMIEKLIKGTVS